MTGGPTVMTFQEFLRKKAPAAFDPSIRRERDDWVNALADLRNDLKGWVRELDPDGVLSLRDRDYPKYDRRLGRFDAPGLEIVLDRVKVDVEPGTRYGQHTPKTKPSGSWVLDSDRLGPSEGVAFIHGPGLIHPLHYYRPIGGKPVWVLEDRPPGYRTGAANQLDREQFALVLQDSLS